MRKIKDVRYVDDCIRIKEVLLNNWYDATLEECEDLREKYSESMCAWWIILPDSDDELFYSLGI